MSKFFNVAIILVLFILLVIIIVSSMYERISDTIRKGSSFKPSKKNKPIDAKDGRTSKAEEVLGHGGIDYNKSSKEQKKRIEENERRLKEDKDFRESEKKRAEAVIAQRKAAGLDTIAQEKYLARL
ncbi:hypothetical protein [Chengkuizengella sediminis]|uniref:hypothetical protein n=1 Tax=Chengkuizengella sediminis TaxID=1885917 RepID=UPI001389F280|nr:hypothetical protein [Chengkuizengella sediminis]NDI34645.1 hypothetical protein [Chengkuizengella sediminis]